MTKEGYEKEVLKLTSIPQVLGLSLTYIMSLEEELAELQERDSRTCESCKYLKERNPFNKPVFPRHACSHADVIYMCTDKDFCCNKFEKKER